MTPASQLIDGIRKNLAAQRNSRLSRITLGSGPDNLYEVWIWSVLVREASAIARVDVNLEGLTASRSLRFRKGPGHLRSPGYSYATFSRGGSRTVEAHIGAFVLGQLGVEHEADILVVPARVADAVRGTSTGIPWHDKLAMVIEAKFTRTKRQLWLGHGRGLLGLGLEVHPNHLLALVSNAGNPSIDTLLPGRFFGGTWPGAVLALQAKLAAELPPTI
jgi:hypothetical protein